MLTHLFTKIFHQPDRNARGRGSTCPARGRLLCLESLESREMLSITPLEFNAIRDHFSSWDLSDNMTDYNRIEITAFYFQPL